MKPRREAISLRCSSFIAIPFAFSSSSRCVQHRAASTVRLPLLIGPQTTRPGRLSRWLRLANTGGVPMAQRDLDSTEKLLQELLWTYGPGGQEDAVRAVCARELQPLVDDMWTDDAGNLIGYIGAEAGATESLDHRRRRSSVSGGSAIRVMAHLDELSMLVKRVESDGS